MKKPALMSCIIGFVSQQIFAGWQCPGQGCNPLDSGSLSWRDIESQRPLFPVADGMKFRIVSALAYTDSSEQSPPLSAVCRLPSAERYAFISVESIAAMTLPSDNAPAISRNKYCHMPRADHLL